MHCPVVAIRADVLVDISARLYEEACKTVPFDVKQALEDAYQKESSYLAREQLRQMLEGIRVAKEDDNVICSDMGIPHFFVKYGTEVELVGDLGDAIAGKRGAPSQHLKHQTAKGEDI